MPSSGLKNELKPEHRLKQHQQIEHC